MCGEYEEESNGKGEGDGVLHSSLPLITRPGPSLMARHALPGCSFFALANQGTKVKKGRQGKVGGGPLEWLVLILTLKGHMLS